MGVVLKEGKTAMSAIARVAVAVAAASGAALVGLGYWFSEFALNKDSKAFSVAVKTEVQPTDAELAMLDERAAENRKRLKADAAAWLDGVDVAPCTINSDDGLRLYGETIEHGDETHRWAVLLHGFRGSGSHDMVVHAHALYNGGYNILWMDLRSCGQSEGVYTTMGERESTDLIRWLEWLKRHDPEAEAMVLGVSLGAATALMAIGKGLPDMVKCIVSDCAYSSLREEYADKIDKAYHGVNPDLLLGIGDLSLRARFGFSLDDIDLRRVLANNTLPVLYIHGDADDFNPYWMHFELLQADDCADKAFLNVHGARHARNVYMEPERYWQTLFAFCDRHFETPPAETA